jgi:hypothetical protein
MSHDRRVEAGIAVGLAAVVLIVSPGPAVDAIVVGVLLVVVLADLITQAVRRRRMR